MQIELKQIVPVPLKDKFSKRGSDIWNKHLQFNNAEWIKIKAPSGTGKTTFVHIIYKMRYDYEGSVAWDNTDLKLISGDALAQLRQNKLSIIFQDLRLFPNLTARENIELKRVLQTPFYEAGIIDTMAERLGITHIMEQRAGLCSYGEQQRIAVIRALIQPFNWLIMDEPFSHLDNNNSERAMELMLEEAKSRNAAIIFADLERIDYFPFTKIFHL